MKNARALSVNEATCKACGACLRLGCPAISKLAVERDGKPRTMPNIDPLLCAGCGVCASICPFDAIS